MMDTKELCGAGRGDRRGFNQTTASGRAFWALDPRPEDIHIEDIAAQLSRVCRFGGALKNGAWVDHSVACFPDKKWVPFEIYSVAQHCDLVSRNVPEEHALEGLLHDAAEAYIGDMVKPLKVMIPEFKKIERRIMAAVRERFGLPQEESEFVKIADYRAVLTEHRDLQNDIGEVDWGVAKMEPWPEQIIPVLPSVARKMFMDRFNELYRGE